MRIDILIRFLVDGHLSRPKKISLEAKKRGVESFKFATNEEMLEKIMSVS